MRYLLACALLLAVPAAARTQPDTAQQDFDRGVELDAGQGSHPDAAGAFQFYLRAARQNLPDAEFNVAVIYDSGQGAPPDPAQAARWYAAAAAAGSRRAAYNLGQLYEQGDGVPRDPNAARAWFHLAAGQGVTAAKPHVRDRMLKEPDAPANTLDSARPIAPADETVMAPSRRPPALVWVPPPGSGHVTYFAEVLALTQGTSNIIFAGETDVTAILAAAPFPAGRYAWRVFAIHDKPTSYVPSAWTRFFIGNATQGPQTTYPP